MISPSTSTMNPPNAAKTNPPPVPSRFGSASIDGEGLTGPSEDKTTKAQEHSEGIVARTIESQTAKLPSDVFLWCAVGAMGISLALQLAGKKSNGLFVGQWAAPFLLMGVYNKLVKIGGSDRLHE